MIPLSDPIRRAAVRRLAEQIKSRTIAPTVHFGVVTSYSFTPLAGSPPSCNVKLDGTEAIIPNVRFSQSVWPNVNDVVMCVEYDGDLWVQEILVRDPWVSATLVNGVTNYDTTTDHPARYRRLPGGLVEIGGTCINGGTINPIAFTLPTEFRPSRRVQLRMLYWTGSAFATGPLAILTNGNVQPTALANQLFYLDGSIYPLS